ncbi:hypothetical protein [Actinoplanes palleronii]|uniref:PLAT domain-containing protein n=1 Tax=Actinoplanes palleronii TaxID=113570 RepID=A0ABQ4BA14_9ACTN|nr:hypothetical protein [Actinoplanes palleronii]GIE67554.1 hypothetical protein Apa02nite_036620 [Actinoplanes palleronii]
MPLLSGITVIHTTKDESDAGTDADFVLEIERPGDHVELDFPNLPHNERERGRTDQYQFDVSKENLDSDDPFFKIRMRLIGSEDGWLPQSIFVFGQTVGGTTVVLGAHPEWSDGWFDKGSDAAGPDVHTISG